MSLGAIIASFEHIRTNWIEKEFRHSVIAFGGGALLSAVALVLVPEGIKHLNIITVSIAFIFGSLAFMLLDIFLNKQGTSASQLTAMLLDFLPESVALGATFAISQNNALLLAGLIALQNLPEGFNAFRELKVSTNYKSRNIVLIFTMMSLLGPMASITGYYFLSYYPPIVSVIMLFASGGILYSIFQDIAPQVKLRKHYAPPLGAIFGFLIGLIGFLLAR